ncbi:MAG: tRNA (N6-threonylcarbamoyladenosine(37)-N6)-methyltransferase TrmO [Bacillota bacterium]
MIQLKEIGVVRNRFKQPTDHEKMRKCQSAIHIRPEYAEGLYRLEENRYIQVIFAFDRAGSYTLKGPRRHGHVLGVFASRSPHRPSPIGTTVVQLLAREGLQLTVRGLDALDGTPVLDIKPHVPSMDHPEESESRERLHTNPRQKINQWIAEEDWESLLLGAGELHGHFCPFMALGVRAGALAVTELGLVTSGTEDVIAIVETNNCFSDGIQYATGCTFGNNALVYRDYGKTAFTLAVRGGPALRLHLKRPQNLIREHSSPEATRLFEQVIARRDGTPKAERQLQRVWSRLAFKLIELPTSELFEVQRNVTVRLPDYAPIHDTVICERCGEEVVTPRAITGGGARLCIPCAGVDYLQLDGRGLTKPGTREDGEMPGPGSR